MALSKPVFECNFLKRIKYAIDEHIKRIEKFFNDVCQYAPDRQCPLDLDDISAISETCHEDIYKQLSDKLKDLSELTVEACGCKIPIVITVNIDFVPECDHDFSSPCCHDCEVAWAHAKNNISVDVDFASADYTNSCWVYIDIDEENGVITFMSDKIVDVKTDDRFKYQIRQKGSEIIISPVCFE